MGSSCGVRDQPSWFGDDAPKAPCDRDCIGEQCHCVRVTALCRCALAMLTPTAVHGTTPFSKRQSVFGMHGIFESGTLHRRHEIRLPAVRTSFRTLTWTRQCIPDPSALTHLCILLSESGLGPKRCAARCLRDEQLNTWRHPSCAFTIAARCCRPMSPDDDAIANPHPRHLLVDRAIMCAEGAVWHSTTIHQCPRRIG